MAHRDLKSPNVLLSGGWGGGCTAAQCGRWPPLSCCQPPSALSTAKPPGLNSIPLFTLLISTPTPLPRPPCLQRKGWPRSQMWAWRGRRCGAACLPQQCRCRPQLAQGTPAVPASPYLWPLAPPPLLLLPQTQALMTAAPLMTPLWAAPEVLRCERAGVKVRAAAAGRARLPGCRCRRCGGSAGQAANLHPAYLPTLSIQGRHLGLRSSGVGDCLGRRHHRLPAAGAGPPGRGCGRRGKGVARGVRVHSLKACCTAHCLLPCVCRARSLPSAAAAAPPSPCPPQCRSWPGTSLRPAPRSTLRLALMPRSWSRGCEPVASLAPAVPRDCTGAAASLRGAQPATPAPPQALDLTLP